MENVDAKKNVGVRRNAGAEEISKAKETIGGAVPGKSKVERVVVSEEAADTGKPDFSKQGKLTEAGERELSKPKKGDCGKGTELMIWITADKVNFDERQQ